MLQTKQTRAFTLPPQYGVLSAHGAWEMSQQASGCAALTHSLSSEKGERDFTREEETEAAGAPWLMFDATAASEKQTNRLWQTLCLHSVDTETGRDSPYREAQLAPRR